MKAGDVVELKSGGIPYTIMKIEGETAHLVRDGCGHIEQIILPVIVLKPAKEKRCVS